MKFYPTTPHEWRRYVFATLVTLVLGLSWFGVCLAPHGWDFYPPGFQGWAELSLKVSTALLLLYSLAVFRWERGFTACGLLTCLVPVFAYPAAHAYKLASL